MTPGPQQVWVSALPALRIFDGVDELPNSPMLPDMKENEDGSMTIYMQKDSPGADKESNRLPAPDGPIYLAMRLYWPKTEPPSILSTGAGTWSPPGIEVAD